ncbi:MAG: type I DNA topoisomerase [Armatimonadota bacterium]|nr:MAG: type I DNA topoisomerase [Armatimonadota bacterium]
MGKPIIIVESPAKTRTLSTFVGSGYEIAASMGHVRDLPPKKLGVDVEKDFAPEYELLADRKSTLSQLRSKVKAADEVYLASDPDREGEAIAWHLTQALKIANPKRIEFNEITRRAVQRALEHPREIDMRRVNAQQARRVLDRLVGYKLSPLLMRKLRRRALSAGRVQSVAVKLVCDREREIEAFDAQEYWDIFAHLTPAGEEEPFRAKLVQIDGAKAAVGDAERAAEVCADARGQEYRVARVKRSERKRGPLPPFITSTLQQDAFNRLGMSARRTMVVAQQLYEGLELGAQGSVGLITYMRTDSTRVAAEAQAEAREHVAAELGPDYVPERPRHFAARKGAQEAHEAIRPTSVALDPDAVAQYLNRDQLRLYRLIWSRFVASQMADATLDVMVVDAAGGPYLFRVTGQAVTFPGFMRVYSPTKKIQEEEQIKLPALQEGQALRLLDIETTQKFTQPPPRYTEASLVRALEAKGIGRPSTYAPILATIRERGYIYLDAKHLRPTDLGCVITDQLSEHFPRIMDVEFTARVEEQLDRVEQGEEDWVALLRTFYGPFEESLEQAEEKMGPVRMPVRETEEKCPECGKPLVIRTGKRGPFLHCSGFPACRYSVSLGDDEKPRPAAQPTDQVCAECGRPMLLRTGRRGQFLGCSGYPECKHTRPLDEQGEPDAPQTPCPECGRPLVLRRSRRGPFLGCTGYPECKHTERPPRAPREEPIPTGESCELCGEPMVTRKGRRGAFAGCSAYPKCRNTRPLEEGELREPESVTQAEPEGS